MESRRLFASFALDIDPRESEVIVTASVDNNQLFYGDDFDHGFARFAGTLNVSSTARGVKFEAGSDIRFDRSNQQAQVPTETFRYNLNANGTRLLALSNVDLDVTSGRLATPGGKYAANRLTVHLTDGDVDVDGASAALPDLSSPILNHQRAQVFRGESSLGAALKVKIPIRLTLQTTIFYEGQTRPLAIAIAGAITARGHLGVNAASLTPAPREPIATRREKESIFA